MAGGVKVRWGIALFFTFILGVIYGCICIIGLLIDIVRKGPSRVLHVRRRDVRPEILNNSAFGSHEFVRLGSTGLKLHYVANGSSNKPLMIFIHGFPEFWYSWRYQLKEFSKDYRTIAYDMRGYGDSDKPAGSCEYTLDKLVEDLNQLITELGYDKCIVVGHDWGGIVAWSFAALHPDKVERLIIANSPHPAAFEANLASEAFHQLKSGWLMFVGHIPALPECFIMADDLSLLDKVFCGPGTGAKPGTFKAEDMEAFKYTFATYDNLKGPVNYLRAFLRYHTPQVETALRRKISVPTLVIWGTNDAYVEKKMAELSGRFVEQFSLRYIEGASHWVQQEEPEQFNLLLRQFLKNEL